jgi:hypothetical protein
MIKVAPVSDEKDYIGFLSIAKHGGVWKSHAQRQFWFKHDNLRFMPEHAQHAAVGAVEGDLVVQFHGTMRWADYGARSIIPVLIYVILDQVGVRRVVHVGGHGNARDGWQPDFNAKVKVKFERPEGVEGIPVPEPLPVVLSHAVGAVGDKLDVSATVIYFKASSFQVSYNVSTSSFFHILKDADGNIYKYKGSSVLGEQGDRVEFKATVKAHEEGRDAGSVVTVLKAPKNVLTTVKKPS